MRRAHTFEDGFLKLPLTGTLMHDRGFLVEYGGRVWDSSELLDLVLQAPESEHPGLYERLCGVSREITALIRNTRDCMDFTVLDFLSFDRRENAEGLIRGLESLNGGIVYLEEASRASRRITLARSAAVKEPLYLTGLLRNTNGSLLLQDGSRYLFTIQRLPGEVLDPGLKISSTGSILRPELSFTRGTIDEVLEQTPGAVYAIDDFSLGCTEDVWGLRSLLISDYVRVKRKIYNEKLCSYPHVN